MVTVMIWLLLLLLIFYFLPIYLSSGSLDLSQVKKSFRFSFRCIFTLKKVGQKLQHTATGWSNHPGGDRKNLLLKRSWGPKGTLNIFHPLYTMLRIWIKV